MRLFFTNFLMSPKCPPFIFFDILQQNGRSKNPKGSPLLHFSALCDLPETSKQFRKKIGKKFSQYCFHYFDIVRLFRQKNFPQRFRLHFFWSFAAEWMLKNTKRSVPVLVFFRNCETFVQFFFTEGSLSRFCSPVSESNEL